MEKITIPFLLHFVEKLKDPALRKNKFNPRCPSPALKNKDKQLVDKVEIPLWKLK